MGIVISALQVVEFRFYIIHITAIPQRVQVAKAEAGIIYRSKQLTPGVVGVCNHGSTGAVQNRHHIALQVGCVVVSVPTVDQGKGVPIDIVGEMQCSAVVGHVGQLRAMVGVLVSVRPIRPLRAKTCIANE